MTIGEKVKQYRSQCNLSQREFAAKCGLSNGIISMIEKGVNPNTNEPIIPSLPTLNSIAKVMGMTIDELLEQLDDMDISLSRTAEKGQNSRTTELIRLFNKLSAEQQKMIIAQIKGILSEET